MIVSRYFNTRHLATTFFLTIFAFAGQAQTAVPAINSMVVFGDSVSDTGNGSIIWNGQSSAPWQAAIPTNNYSNNRYTDGPDTQPATSQPAKIWTDLLAAKLGIAAPTASLVGGTNYAAFGAMATNGSAQYPSLDMQVQQAIGRGISPGALYVIWGGANDITNQQDESAVVPAAVAAARAIQQQIATLAANGAKYFIWVNMPPFNRIPPGASSPSLNAAYGQASVAFNREQAAQLSLLRNQFASQGVVIVPVDAYAIFNNILDNPSSFGFTNVNSSAAGQQGVNPDTYAFWKDGHFTTSLHAVIADEAFRIVQRELAGGRPLAGTNGPGNGRADFDGDGRSDFTVWGASDYNWHILPGNLVSGEQTIQWGIFGDVPVPGDYDGDGISDVATWRPADGVWYVIPSTNKGAAYSQQWGLPGDVPVPADYDGDGRTDFAVWRRSSGVWYVIPSGNAGAAYTQQWGLPGDITVPGDYDGDGRADFAIWRPAEGMWYVLPSSNTSTPSITQWGLPGDIPMPGDYDGDGRVDRAVWRPSEGQWYVNSETSGTSTIQWGLPGDIPVYGDFDGDGRTDRIVWRPATGVWYALPSNGSSPIMQTLGMNGDAPL